MNIYEKMSAITSEITAVAKNLNVGWGKNQYKAVGEADVLAAVKPIEARHKIYSYPYERDIVENAVITTTKPDGTESKQQFMRIRTVYRFVDAESPTDYIDIVTYGDGVDSQDKAPGKAMTYADKYALLKAYKIITGDDPDQKMSEPLKSKEEKAQDVANKKISVAKATALAKLCSDAGVDIQALLVKYKVADFNDLTEYQAAVIAKAVEKKDGKNR